MRNNLISFGFALIAGYAAGQNSIFSPWSSRGFGDRSLANHGIFTGIGNCRVSYTDSTVLNFYNPSSYSLLSKGMPLYSIGLNARYAQFIDGQKNNWNFTAVPDHFAMGFGLKKHIGFAFGLKPFTRIGYELTERTKIGTDSLKYVYKGKGGTQAFFIGFSTPLINLKNTQFCVGANGDYIFGTAHKERQSLLITNNNNVGGVDWSELKLNAFHYELAASLHQKLGINHSISMTTVIEPQQRLKGTTNSYLFYGNVEDPELMDTLNSSTNVKTNVAFGGKTQFGFVWKIRLNDSQKDNSLRKSEIAFHINYTHSLILKDSIVTPVINHPSVWNFGLQYTPEIGFQENGTGLKFIEKLHYRAGFYRQTLPYTYQSSAIFDKGFTLGFGVPVTSFRTLSSLNFSFIAGEQSGFNGMGFRERYAGFSFGVILAPSNFDKWFVKRKLD
jgi:hypothetical protein